VPGSSGCMLALDTEVLPTNARQIVNGPFMSCPSLSAVNILCADNVIEWLIRALNDYNVDRRREHSGACAVFTLDTITNVHGELS
jgi:hypothetical protein